MAGTTFKIKQSSVAGKVPAAGSLVQGELALNTSDQKLYSKDSVGSVFEIGGGSGGGANEIITTEYISVAGQTSYSALYNVFNDHVNVFYNGMKLAEGDFTATTGTEVVLADPALVDDIVTIEVIKALNLANGSDITEHEFVAVAGQTDFAIPNGGYNKVADNLEVFINGIKLLGSADFTYTDGTNVVLTDPADLDDEVTIKQIKLIALASVVNSTDTSAIIPAGSTADRDTTPEAGYLRWNTDLNSTEVYNGTAWEKVGYFDQEQTEDIVGAMVDANTETNIVVTYNDTTGKLNFAVADLDWANITNKPSTYPASSHTHAIAETTGLQSALDGKVDDSQVLTNVPAGAVFTDTTYTVGDGGLTEINFTSAKDTKLTGIETGATADQTNAEIKIAYEANTNTNEFSDAEQTKLAGIATSANNYSHPTGAGNEHLPATVSQTEAGYLDGVTSAIQTQLDGKVDDSQVLTNVPSGAVFTDTETTTSLSVAANILTYTDELGAGTNIDLSLYLDDTNAAYITSGSLNGTTGVATFTRSDSTSFDVNMSAFLDDTKLTDAEIAAMGYIKVDTQVTVNNTLTSTSTTEALSAAQGKALKDTLDTKVTMDDVIALAIAIG